MATEIESIQFFPICQTPSHIERSDRWTGLVFPEIPGPCFPEKGLFSSSQALQTAQPPTPWIPGRVWSSHSIDVRTSCYGDLQPLLSPASG
ncbi:hypothetical protein CDAR_562181 [Caerostris darwini]|uniref:Uncharacterized protein n=1 Tax=Caerostris darwini TaxID=1538125 RepID=A0AAV4PDQ9_9ARAC|nr:hypothetical protein CDAR_562181 [Caerostris darwini]